MTEPNIITLIDLESEKTALQNCILKITKNSRLKSKKNPLRSFKLKIQFFELFNTLILSLPHYSRFKDLSQFAQKLQDIK